MLPASPCTLMQASVPQTALFSCMLHYFGCTSAFAVFNESSSLQRYVPPISGCPFPYGLTLLIPASPQLPLGSCRRCLLQCRCEKTSLTHTPLVPATPMAFAPHYFYPRLLAHMPCSCCACKLAPAYAPASHSVLCQVRVVCPAPFTRSPIALPAVLMPFCLPGYSSLICTYARKCHSVCNPAVLTARCHVCSLSAMLLLLLHFVPTCKTLISRPTSEGLLL